MLFAGVGRGRDAVHAAARGVDVTACDVAPAMLARFERALARARLQAEIHHGGVASLAQAGDYDAIVASFFLDLYTASELGPAIAPLRAALRPGGRLWVADFAPADGGLLRRAAAQLHYWPVALAGRALGLAALHPLIDYGEVLSEAGLDAKVEGELGLYRVWSARAP